MRADPWFARRLGGFMGYGSTPLHYPLHPSIDPATCQRERRYYGGLRIVIVSHGSPKDRTLRCRIRANVRPGELIRAKIRSIYTHTHTKNTHTHVHTSRYAARSDLSVEDLRRICGNDGNRRNLFPRFAMRSASILNHVDFKSYERERKEKARKIKIKLVKSFINNISLNILSEY